MSQHDPSEPPPSNVSALGLISVVARVDIHTNPPKGYDKTLRVDVDREMSLYESVDEIAEQEIRRQYPQCAHTFRAVTAATISVATDTSLFTECRPGFVTRVLRWVTGSKSEFVRTEFMHYDKRVTLYPGGVMTVHTNNFTGLQEMVDAADEVINYCRGELSGATPIPE